jgi:GntR family transcriptional regulator
MGSGAAQLDRSSALPLWAQLQADLRRRIDADAFATGFPGELALVAQYGVSRQTVREALRRLRADGLVVAERGRAPRLASQPQFAQPLGALYSLFSSVEARGAEQRSEVRRQQLTADGVVAARLGLEESTPLFFLERLRLADGEPLAMDRVWLPAAVAAPLLDADFTHTSLYEQLATRCAVRLHGGQEQIRAVLPSAADRRMLRIDSDVALLAIDRTAWAGGAPVEWRQTLVRGDRFAVTATFAPSNGPQLTVGGQHRPTDRPAVRPLETRSTA